MQGFERALDCFADGPDTGARPIHVCRPGTLPDLLARLPSAQAAYLAGCPFGAKAGEVVLLPGEAGVAAAVLGLGESRGGESRGGESRGGESRGGESPGPHVFGALPPKLPAGQPWRMAETEGDPAEPVLGWALGAYRHDRLRSRAAPAGPLLVVPPWPGREDALSAARATWLARDLVNMPANLLGPAELAAVARDTMVRAGAHVDVITGAALEASYPVLHAVGRGSARGPAVVLARWQHPTATTQSPLLSLCGKGVCFDTGGYDLKPPAGMLRMKKDMGGAAVALGLARMIIDAALPVRLELRLGCAENMVSGEAMRPLDLLKTREGVAIEVGNTDAEGRLVLCELLAEASAVHPAALLDFATLTGAARVALGPDLPALFSNDDVLATVFLASGTAVHDAVWRLPLWHGYNSWLDGGAGDMNNVSEKAHAGAIVAALFLQRFVLPGTRWAHFDVYAWNDANRTGRPVGGEAQAMRAAFAGLRTLVSSRFAG